MSFSITRKINIDSAHRVPLHGSKCKNLHGHTYIVEATFGSPELESKGAQTGMVLDFGFMKDVMLKAAHNSCDHATIMYYKDPLLGSLMDCSVYSPHEKLLERIKYVFQQSFLDAMTQIPHEKWELVPVGDRGKLSDMMAGYVEERSVQHFHMFLAPETYNHNHPYRLRHFLYELARDILDTVALNELFSLETLVKYELEDNHLRVELKRDLDRSQAVWHFDVTGIAQYGWEQTQIYVVSFVPTAENLAKHWGQRMGLELKLDERVPHHVYVKNVRVWETPNCFADYTPLR